jgi:hypothetical protein
MPKVFRWEDIRQVVVEAVIFQYFTYATRVEVARDQVR